jgi:hypothetical protein
MKNKLNLCLALALLGMAVTAYSTCYLNQVVLCFKSGDLISTGSSGYWHASGTVIGGTETYGTFYTDVYADEDSWRYDKYSVPRGGKTPAVPGNGYTSYCVGTCTGGAGGAGPYTQGNDPFGFQAHYYNPLIFSTISAYNGNPTIIGTTTTVCGGTLEVQAFRSFSADYVNNGSGYCN